MTITKKPLLRYTMGKVSSLGWTILFESIRNIKKVYPEFDIVICHNKLSFEEISMLTDLGVDLIAQDQLEQTFAFVDDDEGKIRNFCWKLMPPRLRLESHELWVDNDIIIRERIEGIDRWLQGSTSIISRGFCHDYGRFAKSMQFKDSCCAGFFGLPPNFDFQSEINRLCDGKPLKGFDEQGLVSVIVTSIEGFIMLPHRDLVLLSETWKPRPDFWIPKGLHFARSNRFTNHVSWKLYKTAIMP